MPSRCPFYYHTMTNVYPKQCKKEAGHEGEHEEEQNFPTQLQSPQQLTGWQKH